MSFVGTRGMISVGGYVGMSVRDTCVREFATILRHILSFQLGCRCVGPRQRMERRTATWRKVISCSILREEVYAALQFGSIFHCLVEELKDSEEVKPKPTENRTLVDKWKQRSIARSGVRQQTHFGI